MRELRPAFVIHGGPGGDHSDLKTAFHPLSQGLQLVYFDHREQGRSARGDKRLNNLDENVQDMEALRQHLGLGAIVSIGTSYGGMVAMAHAARGSAEQITVCKDLWADRLDTAEKLRRYYELMGPLYSTKHDAAAARLSRERGILSPEAINQAFAPGGFLQSFDLRPELGQIRASTLILAGRHDWICPPEFSEEIHRLIAGSRLTILEESSHSIRVDERDKMLAAIAAFVAG